MILRLITLHVKHQLKHLNSLITTSKIDIKRINLPFYTRFCHKITIPQQSRETPLSNIDYFSEIHVNKQQPFLFFPSIFDGLISTLSILTPLLRFVTVAVAATSLIGLSTKAAQEERKHIWKVSMVSRRKHELVHLTILATLLLT